jgi:hypothetical protein
MVYSESDGKMDTNVIWWLGLESPREGYIVVTTHAPVRKSLLSQTGSEKALLKTNAIQWNLGSQI